PPAPAPPPVPPEPPELHAHSTSAQPIARITMRGSLSPARSRAELDPRALPYDEETMIALQDKTLRRIRDHLLEVGQPPSVHFMRASDVGDPFAGDPDARQRFEALFEAMYLMVVA